MAALAGSLREVSERRGAVGSDREGQVIRFDLGQANATVFAAISTVLGFDAATLDKLATAQYVHTAHQPFGDAVGQIAACQLDVADKLAWVARMGVLQKTIVEHRQPELAGLLEILANTLASCT